MQIAGPKQFLDVYWASDFSEWWLQNITEVPLIQGFAFWGFSYQWSNAVQKDKTLASRHLQLSLTLGQGDFMASAG